MAAYVAAAAAQSPVSVAAGVQARRHEALGLQRRQRVLRAGVRQSRVQRGAEAALAVFTEDDRHRPDGARLPPDRARDRRRGARLLPRQRRPRVRRRLTRSAGRATTTASSSAPSQACRRRTCRPSRGGSARALWCGGSDFIAYQCVHGLGHGLMIYTGYDLPLALATCDKLATSWDQTSCTGGVFMENLQTSYGTTSQWLKDDNPLVPVHDRLGAAQALLLPDGHVAHPRRRRRRLGEDGRVVPQVGAELGRHVLPVARPRRLGPIAPETRRRSSASARSPATRRTSASTAQRATSRAWTPARGARPASARRRRRPGARTASTASARSSAASRGTRAPGVPAAARPCRSSTGRTASSAPARS